MGFDIDEGMVEKTLARANGDGISNIRAFTRDVLAEGYGIEYESCDAVLLMNILHCRDPVHMLKEAAHLLKLGVGRIYATHWQHDQSTPRGPPMEIRPRPEQLPIWAAETGLLAVDRGPIDLPPWHYGWVFQRSLSLPTRANDEVKSSFRDEVGA